METTTRTRLHPLLTAAAVSLIVLSGVGVAAMTGVLPASRGSTEPVIAPEVQKPIEHAVTMPAPADTTAAPVAKPKPRHVARAVAPRPPAPAPVASAEPLPPIAQAPAVKPAPLPGVGGVVESVKEVEQKGENPIAGPVIGGIAGAVLGHQVGSGTGRTIATAVGAGAGVLGGKVIEQKVRATKHWETTVRLDDGSTQSFKSEAQPAWQAGQHVRIVDGQLQKS